MTANCRAPTPAVMGVANSLPSDLQVEVNDLLSTVGYLLPVHLQGTPTVSLPEEDETPVYSTPDLTEEYPKVLRRDAIPSEVAEARRA